MASDESEQTWVDSANDGMGNPLRCGPAAWEDELDADIEAQPELDEQQLNARLTS